MFLKCAVAVKPRHWGTPPGRSRRQGLMMSAWPALGRETAGGSAVRTTRHETPYRRGAWRRKPLLPLAALGQGFGMGRWIRANATAGVDEARTAGCGVGTEDVTTRSEGARRAAGVP